MKYKLAIFDFDGTLADSFPFFLTIFNSMADLHGFKRVTTGEAEMLRQYDAKRIMSYLGLPLWKAPKVVRSFKAAMAKEIDHVPLFPGVKTTLHALAKNNIELGLMTSNSYDNARKVLSTETIDLMTHCQCDISILGKRSRLKKILKKIAVPRNEIIYIGDELRDIDAADAEGIPFGAVSWGYTSLDALITRSPALVFSSADEIIEKIL